MEVSTTPQTIIYLSRRMKWRDPKELPCSVDDINKTYNIIMIMEKKSYFFFNQKKSIKKVDRLPKRTMSAQDGVLRGTQVNLSFFNLGL